MRSQPHTTTLPHHRLIPNSCESAISREWRERLARKPLLDGIAESLFQHAFTTAPIDEPQVQRANIDARWLIAADGGDVFAAL